MKSHVRSRPGATLTPLRNDATAGEDILASPERDRRLSLLAKYLVNTLPEQPGLSLSARSGLSSLDMAELVTRIEATSGTPLGDVTVPQHATLADVARLARSQTAPTNFGGASTLPARQRAGHVVRLADLLGQSRNRC